MVSDVNAALTSDAISSKIVMLIEKHPTIMNAKSKLSGSVVAGFPSPAEQYMEPPLDLNELLVKRPAATYFVRVSGDSMIGAGINDGDILVVDRSLRPADGDIIIACVDGDFTVKRFRERGTGKKKKICLEPANPNYPVLALETGQELDYFGKVTACIHKF
jgi:DNA polymerase V